MLNYSLQKPYLSIREWMRAYLKRGISAGNKQYAIRPQNVVYVLKICPLLSKEAA
jgi:hypothetical protein